jgi:V/A-type H+-transporting ATPase subunit I
MILKMKKYTFLVYHKQYITFLEKIREVGVLHVIEKPEGIEENDTLREKMQLAARVKNALSELEKYTPKNAELMPADKSIAGLAALLKVESTLDEKEVLEQKLQLTDKDRDRMEVWGRFSHKRLQQIKEMGFVLNFFSCNLRKFDQEWEVLYNAFEIDTVGTTRYFLTITRPGETIDIDADHIKLSNSTAEQLDIELKEIRSSIENTNADLVQMSIEDYNTLKSVQGEILSDIDFSNVILNTRSEADEKVKLLEGWCPEKSEEALQVLLKEEGIYYESSDPEITEAVPIVLKNNSFSKLFEPITNLFSLPNYTELDPTPFFAPFFMLFFGLCLGDGGYGLIIWAVSTFAKRKSKPDMKGLLTLGQYLGIATVVVGLLTGSFFGIALDQVEWKWLSGVKQYFITQGNFGAKLGGYNPMMVLAVVIGIIQILFGMMVNVLKVNKQHGFRHAVGHLAWVVFIISMILLMGLPIFGLELLPVALYTLYGFIALSVLCILFYNSPGKNIFLNMGSALWNTYNMATGLLGDTLSYIRLFALGLTGSILGGVFNTLAFDLTESLPIYTRWLVVLLILLAGHSINFGLCLIGAFVHPLRLTFVEFYKNAGFEGGGKAYKPLKKNI